jgi:hypothetical protein
MSNIFNSQLFIENVVIQEAPKYPTSKIPNEYLRPIYASFITVVIIPHSL